MISAYNIIKTTCIYIKTFFFIVYPLHLIIYPLLKAGTLLLSTILIPYSIEWLFKFMTVTQWNLSKPNLLGANV